MPKVQLSNTGPTDAAIAADAGRSYIEISADTFGEVRWCFGATYVEADSQALSPAISRPFQGVPAQQAFSFGPGKGQINVTTL